MNRKEIHMPTQYTTEVANRLRNRSKPGPNGCINTTYALSSRNDYGTITIDKRTHYVHRVAWELANGSIPDGMCVCHTCDNPRCINPDHMFLGTIADNLQDMTNKGRRAQLPHLRGNQNGRAILDDADILDIRTRAASGEMYESIAKRYDTAETNVGRIVRRETWRHI